MNIEENDIVLRGKTALITGAGQGIGRACAEILASRGANLFLLDKNPVSLDKLKVNLIKKDENFISTHILDLNDFNNLGIVLKKIKKLGPVNILVNNAGFDSPGTSEKVSFDGFNAVIGIHLKVPLFLIKSFLPAMKSARWGRIINISSIYALTGGKGEVAYSTAKAGLIGMTKSVAKECGKDGVTVNAVLPGLTRTPTIEKFMAERHKKAIIENTPLGRMAEPEEIAKVVAFLASNDSSFITGTLIPVSGGWGI